MPGTSMPKIFVRMLASCWIFGLAVLPALAGLSYSADKIWVLEQDRPPYTQPYDGATSIPGLHVYKGVIRNYDGSPAAYAGFYAQVAPIVKSTGPVQTFVGGIEMQAGANGRFQFALKDYSSHGMYMTGRDAAPTDRSQESFKLSAGVDNVIISRLRADVPARLVLADGTVMTKQDIPSFSINGIRQPGRLGELRGLSPYKPYNDAELYQDRGSTTSAFIIRRLAVPGRYSMLAMGRVFKPFDVDSTDTLVTAYEVVRPFSITGSVRDPAGKPVRNALVVVDNGYSFNMSAIEIPFAEYERLWEETEGNFERHGFYMAKTDANGRYAIKGNCIGRFSKLYAHADGYESVAIPSFLPDDEQDMQPDHLPSDGVTTTATHPNRVPPFDEWMFEGSATVSPIVMAKPAYLTLKLKTDSGILPRAVHFNVAAPQLRTSGTITSHWVTRSAQGDQDRIKVPAEVPFELLIGAAKVSDAQRVTIANPLKPGEVRDLGVVKFQPAEGKRAR